MKKSKLLSRLLRGSSGGSTKASSNAPPELGEAGVAPNPVVAARSSSGRRRDTVAVSAPTSTTTARDPSLFYQQQGQAPPRAGVERSSSWKYTHDHTPDSFSINSSPSILDGRSGTGSQRGTDEGQTIEKSQSWSGDRLLDCATDSGSSRGGTNNSSRAGSGSRAGSRTGTSSRSSRERGVMGGPPSIPASSRTGSRAGSATASRAGSDRGDSTPSSVYDHPVDHSRGTSQTDADGYENVELPSPQRRDSGDSSSDPGSSHQHGSRLSVKSSGRKSRRPSPRRQGILTKSQQESTESRGTRGSVRGNVPSISLSTSSPVPPPKASVSRSPSRKSRRSPSRSPNRPPSRSPSRSDSRKRESVRNSSRSPSRAPSRSPSRGPNGSPVRALSRSPSRLPNRASGIDPWTRMPGVVHDPVQMPCNGEPQFPGNRSMSYEEGRMGVRSPQPPPLWKARSWQQYSVGNSTPQSERARQLAKSRSWQQQHVANLGQGQSVDIVLNRARQHHITRQEAVQPTPSAAMGKSRSWQQSHEADPLPGPLPRTYTVSEKRGRRSSIRLAPPSPTRPSPPSYSHSPARSPLAALPPQSNPSSTTHASIIHDSRHIHHPPMRSQASIGGYGAPPSASHTPHLTDYVELRNYEAMERQQQQQQEYVDLRQYRADQVRPTRDPHWRERFYPPTAFSHLKQLQQQQLQQQLQHQQFQQQLQQQHIRLKQQRQLQHQKSMIQPTGYDSQYGSPQRMDGEYASLQEVRDGMLRNDPVRDAYIQNSAMREGVIRNGSVRNSSIRNGSVRNGSVRNGVVREGSVRDGFVREGSVHRDGSVKGDSTVRYRPPALSKPAQGQTSHGKPVKSSSLMTSQELLNTLKRQLALSSPTHTSRSKSMEAGRAAMAAMGTEGEREEEGKRAVVGEEGGEAGRLSPALMALVAEKRARLKRSTGAFTGSGGGRVPVLRQFTAPPARCTVVHTPS